MSIQLDHIKVNTGIGDPGDPGTVNIVVTNRGRLGRIELMVNVPNYNNESSTLEAARLKLLHWASDLVNDLQSPIQ